MADELAELLTRLSADDDTARQAAEQIAAYGEAALAALQPLLKHELADVRWWAVRTCAYIQDGADIAPFLIQALQDPDPAVRQCAALGLQQRPDDRAVPALIAALSDPDSLVVRLAANALAATGAAAVPELIKLLEDKLAVEDNRVYKTNSKVRLEAIRALALTGDTRSIPTLFEALDSN